MIDNNINFFKIINNFEKTENITSIKIVNSNLIFKPKVTIAIPTYKRPDLLNEAIISALDQINYEHYDIIVVDNDPQRGCNTEKLMINFNNNRISYFKNSENIGMAGNWNRLFELAIGDYVIMLHDDDLLMPNFLVECMRIVEYQPSLGVLSPLKIPFTKPLCQNEINCYLNETNSQSNLLKRIFDIDNYISYVLGPPSGCLFNKECVLKFGGFNHEYFPSIDYNFIVVFSNYYETYIYNKSLTMYRWDRNESLKASILEKFVINDYFLRKSILRKYKVPEMVLDIFLSETTKIFITNCKKINTDFRFNLNDLNIKQSHPCLISQIMFILKVYFNFLKLLRFGSLKFQKILY